MSRTITVFTSILLLGSCNPTVHGQDIDATADAASGILPIPDYSGDVAERGFLLGDFGDDLLGAEKFGLGPYCLKTHPTCKSSQYEELGLNGRVSFRPIQDL